MASEEYGRGRQPSASEEQKGKEKKAHLVEDTVRECRSRADREDVALEARAVRVDIVQRRALLGGRSVSRLSITKAARIARERTVLSQPQIIVPMLRPMPLYE